MPDPDGSGHVQVFHFTSRISKKKISTYETASRRGMSRRDAATPPSDASGPDAGLYSASDVKPHQYPPESDRPPPTKRLKLNVRKPAGHPSATVPAEVDSDIEMVKARSSRQGASKPVAPAVSSDLSSLGSPSPPASRPSSSRNKEYGDFMSYYIMDNDDDDKDDEPGQASPSATVSKVKLPDQPVEKDAVKPAAHQPAPVKPKPKRKRKSSTAEQNMTQPLPNPSQTPVPQPPPLQQPPPPMPMPAAQQPIAIPRIVLIDLEQEPLPQPAGKRDTVQEMIAKLQDLSSALVPFAGIPEPLQPTIQELKKKEPMKKPTPSDNPIDGFLDMFDDESSDDEIEKPAPLPSLDYYLEKPGEPDHALAYGIQFIMNALRSWANQRLQTQFNQQFLETAQQQQAEYQQQQFRRGRPPKNGPGRPGARPPAMPDVPSEIQMSLTNTPEGYAVRAFQEVLRSGSLQMNATLPAELTQALTHIYMQIDRLINQGAKQDLPWQPHSYTAQIDAHRSHVAKLQDDQIRTQGPPLAHHHMHEQQALARMQFGNHVQQMAPAYSPEQHALDIQHRRNSQYFQQQQQAEALSPSVQLGSQAQAAYPAPAASLPLQQAPPVPPQQSQHNGPPLYTGRLQESNSGTPATTPAADKRKSTGPAPAMSNIKMYMPGWLPRSGTQMKFSFSPTGVSYGQQHMQGSPHLHMPPPPPPTQRMEAASPSNGSVGDEIVVAPAGRNGKSETPTYPPHRLVQANSPPAGVPASGSLSPALGSTSTTVSRMQSAPLDVASRFPHPGAVIVDR